MADNDHGDHPGEDPADGDYDPAKDAAAAAAAAGESSDSDDSGDGAPAADAPAADAPADDAVAAAPAPAARKGRKGKRAAAAASAGDDAVPKRTRKQREYRPPRLPRAPEIVREELKEWMEEDPVAKELVEVQTRTIPKSFKLRLLQETRRYLELLDAGPRFLAVGVETDPLGIYDMTFDRTIEGLLCTCYDKDTRDLWGCVLKLYTGFRSIWSKYFSVTGVRDANGLPMHSKMGGFGASAMKALYLIVLDQFLPVLSFFQATGAVIFMVDAARDVELGQQGSQMVEIPCTGIKVERANLKLGVSVMTAEEEREHIERQGGVDNKQIGGFYTSRSQVDRERLTPLEIKAMERWSGLLPSLQFAAVNGQLAPCLGSLGVLINSLSDRALRTNAEDLEKMLRKGSATNHPVKAPLGALKKAFLERLSHDVMRLQDAVAAFSALMCVDQHDRYGSMLVPHVMADKAKPIPSGRATKLALDAGLPLNVLEEMIASAACFTQCSSGYWEWLAELAGRVLSKGTMELLISKDLLQAAADHCMTSGIGKKDPVGDTQERLKELIVSVDVDAFPTEFYSRHGMDWLTKVYQLYDQTLRMAGPKGSEACDDALRFLARASTVENGRFTYPLMAIVDKQPKPSGAVSLISCYYDPSAFLLAVARAIDWKQHHPCMGLTFAVVEQFMELLPSVPFRVWTTQGQIKTWCEIESFVGKKKKVWKRDIKPLFFASDSDNADGNRTEDEEEGPKEGEGADGE